MHITKGKLTIALALLFSLSLTGLVFSPCLRNDFTNYDDPGYVLENPFIKNLSFANLKNIFSRHFVGNYQPLTILSYALEYQFFSLDPYIYHLDNLLLHLGNIILVFWFIYLLTGRLQISLLTALLFGVHPLRVESVAWIAERKDVLYAFFYLGALISYVYSIKRNTFQNRYIGLCWALFLFSLLSKAQAASLPLSLLVIDYFLGRRFNKNLLYEKIPFFMLSFIFGAVTMTIQHQLQAFNPIPAYTFWEKFLFIHYELLAYLGKILIPVNLCCFYPYPEKFHDTLPAIFYYAPFIVLFLGIGVFKTKNHTKSIVFGFLFFFVNIFLLLKIIPVGSFIIADRYTYLPSIGLSFIIAQGYIFLTHHKTPFIQRLRPIIIFLLLVCLTTLSFLTFNRCQVWKDSYTLWSDVIDKYPRVPLAYNNRGLICYSRGQYHAAINDFNQALHYYPNYSQAYNNRGSIYAHLERYDLALQDFNKALAFNPDYREAYNNRGNIHRNRGRFDLALADYNQMLQMDSHDAYALFKRARVYYFMNKLDKALADYEKIIGQRPDDAKAYNEKGEIEYKLGDKAPAMTSLNKAIALDPEYARAYYNRAVIFQDKKIFEAALRDALKAKALGLNVSEKALGRLKKLSHFQKPSRPPQIK
ncbi:MAG: tetratricopeptide repeat protein [Candidatus Omnitrophica bacterium]|nr:tetratricopeptide repeat protein [Candidatus Omnitrophota bacterium]